jgi:hypothetical protein
VLRKSWTHAHAAASLLRKRGVSNGSQCRASRFTSLNRNPRMAYRTLGGSEEGSGRLDQRRLRLVLIDYQPGPSRSVRRAADLVELHVRLPARAATSTAVEGGLI